MVKILAVCGNGLGSSLACQMAIQSVMDEMGVDAKVTHTDTNSCSAMSSDFDILVAGSNFENLIKGKRIAIPTVFLKRLVDKNEIKATLTPVLKEIGALS